MIDKGQTVVILKRKEFLCKIKTILNDSSQFQKNYIDHNILDYLIHMEKRTTEVLRNVKLKRTPI